MAVPKLRAMQNWELTKNQWGLFQFLEQGSGSASQLRQHQRPIPCLVSPCASYDFVTALQCAVGVRNIIYNC